MIFIYQFIKYIFSFFENYDYAGQTNSILSNASDVLGNSLRWFDYTTILSYALIILLSFIIGYICAGTITKLINYTIDGIKSAANENYYVHSEKGVFKETYKTINESFATLQYANKKHTTYMENKEKQLQSIVDELNEHVSSSKAYSEILANTKTIPDDMKEKEYAQITYDNCVEIEKLTTDIQYILKSKENQ